MSASGEYRNAEEKNHLSLPAGISNLLSLSLLPCIYLLASRTIFPSLVLAFYSTYTAIPNLKPTHPDPLPPTNVPY